MDLNTVFTLSAGACLLGQLSLSQRVSDPRQPAATLRAAWLRAGLVIAAAGLTWAGGMAAHWLALAGVTLSWVATALTGHTLLETLARYRDDIATLPLPADQEG